MVARHRPVSMSASQMTAGSGADPVNPDQKPRPHAAIMRALNEAHNLGAVLDNLQGWTEPIFIVDSRNSDETGTGRGMR